MKRIKFLIAAALCLFTTSAMAQTSEPQYVFKKHWFLQLQGGAQHTLGETKFKNLISPNAQVALGYQFSPVIGLRLQANGWQSKGGWNGYDTGFTAKYKWNYVAPGLDVMFNLSNLICGWNPKRVMNWTAFLGGGANIAFKNDEVQTIASGLQNLSNYNLEYLWSGTKVRAFGRAGLAVDFRLSDVVSLGLEGNANILNDKYNSKKADNPDWYFNALVGLKINLGKPYTVIAPVVPEPEPVVEPEPQPVVQPTPKPVVVAPDTLTRNVFFTINVTTPSAKEEQKVKEVANFMKAHPKTKVKITGYADAGTGNDAINDKLAAQRADCVAKELQEKYGIDANRITRDSHGARIQPFAENDLNRVSICIVSDK